MTTAISLLPVAFLKEEVMKKVIFAVLLTAVALFLIVPSLSWAF